MTQEDQILQHLKAGHRIAPLEALERFGCFRLASRISAIKKEGYNVKADMISLNGKTFAEYYLVPGIPRTVKADVFKTQDELFHDGMIHPDLAV